MAATAAFKAFKFVVYGALLLVTTIIFFTDTTIASFIDSLGWLMLLGVMEHESSRHRRAMVRPYEKLVVAVASVLAYGIILLAWWHYLDGGMWLELVNATAWLGVVVVLLWQFYGPENSIHGPVEKAKPVMYTVIVACALIWTFGGFPVIDAVDAWLWLLCFVVIELNVFGFDEQRPPVPRRGARDNAAT